MRFAIPAMGTRFEVVLFAGAGGTGHAQLRAAGEAVIDEIAYWHARLNRFAPDSLVSHIVRRRGEPIRLDRETYDLFADADTVWRASEGAFDITVTGRAHLIKLDGSARTITVDGDDISIDLGGIAKGHALDCARARLEDAGVTAGLIHGGTSSVVAVGRPSASSRWRVALGPDAGDDVVTLADAALSLSDPAGQREVSGSDHIVDPRARFGRPGAARPTERVAVIGPSARLADAWSTALAVLGQAPDTLPIGYDARFLPGLVGAHPDAAAAI